MGIYYAPFKEHKKQSTRIALKKALFLSFMASDKEHYDKFM